MKRVFAALLMLTLLLSVAPMAMAVPDDKVITEGSNNEVRFNKNQPQIWTFTPDVTGNYMLFTPSSGSLQGQIIGQTPSETYDLQTGQHVQVYRLTVGTTYQVQIQLNPAWEQDSYSDVFGITFRLPMYGLTLSSTTMTVKRDDYNSLYVEVVPNYYPLTGLKWTSSDDSILEIDSTQGSECGFWARKAGTATITATLDGKSASCTVTVEKATGEWDDYEVWPASQTKKKLTFANGQPFSYTPTKTATYALHSEGDLHVGMRGTSPSHMLNYRKVDTMQGDYELVDLIAGETYVFEVASNYIDGRQVTGTAYIEEARDISDIILYGANMTDVHGINGYVGGMKELYAMSDPIYAYGLYGGYTYSSSNPAVADPNDEEGASQHINLYQAGSCKITVSCGPVSKSLAATVKPSPVLKAGTTTKLEFALTDAYGVTCLFTPEKSGNYTFSVKGTGGTCHIEGTEIGTYFEGSGSMSGWLQAGKTYKVILGVGETDHTVSVSGGGTEIPTTSSQPTTPSVPTTPSTPTAPSVPTVPVDEELENLMDEMGGSFDGENIQVFTPADSIELSAAHLALLASKGVGLEIGAGMRVKLDSKALAAIAQSGEQSITLDMDMIEKAQLAQAQQNALEDKNTVAIIQATLTAGDQQIHDFAGGKAAVSFILSDWENCAVYYLTSDGKLEKVDSAWADGRLTFTTGHFSEYVVIREENASVSNMGDADGPEDVSEKADWLPWVLIGVAVAAAAAIVIVLLKKKKK